MTQGPQTPYSGDIRNPSLADVISAASRSTMLDLRVSFPATVTEVQDGGARVKVTPDIKNVINTDTGEQIIEQVELSEIPVETYGQGASDGGYLQFPVRVGDKGLVTVSDRNLGGWYATGIPDQPAGYETHNMSDGIFRPGLRDSTRALTQDPTAAVLEHDSIKLGAGATPLLKAARATDATDPTIAMTAWMTAVSLAAAAGVPGPPIPLPATFSTITGGSTKTTIE